MRPQGAYQSVAVADGHGGSGHAGDVAGEKAPLLEGFPEKHLKILLPFGHGAHRHQPPVGPQPEVQLLPENRDVEVEQAAAGPAALGGLIRGAARDAAAGRAQGRGTGGFADPRRRLAGHHVREEATPAIGAEGNDHTILAEFAGQEQLCGDKTEGKRVRRRARSIPRVGISVANPTRGAIGEPRRSSISPRATFPLPTQPRFVVLTERVNRSRINSG